MKQIEGLEGEAIKKATSPFNFVLAPTRSALRNLNITVDGPIIIKRDIVVVPVDIFRFSSFTSVKRRVILHRSDLSVKTIIPVR